jgi:DNA (cytosine-5)-methyltransferase 1
VVNASKLGVPQARKRLVIIGTRRDISAGKVREAAEKSKDLLFGRDDRVRTYPLTPLEAFEGKPLPDLLRIYSEAMREYFHIRPGRGKGGRRGKFDIVKDYLQANGIVNTNAGELDRVFEEHEKLLRGLGYLGRRLEGLIFEDGSNEVPVEAPAVVERMKRIPPGGNHEAVRGTKWEVEGRGISLVYKRIHPLKPAYTVVAFGGGGTWGYHYQRSRSKMTNRERARLQTFPDEFLFKGTVQQIRAQIGEAVPPLLSKRIAEVCHYLLAEVCQAKPYTTTSPVSNPRIIAIPN